MAIVKASTGPCVQCGGKVVRTGSVGPIPKYCSSKCRNLACHISPCVSCGINQVQSKGRRCLECRSRVARKNQPRMCVVCGAIFISKTRQKACSWVCGKALLGKIQGWGKGQVKTSCAFCGNEFARKKWNRESGKYCSRQCAFSDPKWNADRNERNRLRQTLPPEVVQQRLAAKAVRVQARLVERERQKAETKVRQQVRRLATMARNRAEREARPERPCKGCAQPFRPVFGSRLYCSNDCTRRTLKRIHKGTRRARLAGSPNEQVDPMVVLARDGWRCQLCGRKTPKRYRATNRPDAPELDHIVPLALGGHHTYENTQCACRDCNGKKGANVRGQLRLCG